MKQKKYNELDIEMESEVENLIEEMGIKDQLFDQIIEEENGGKEN